VFGRLFTMRRALNLVLVLPLLFAACGPSPEQQTADREEIETLLEEYLPVLGRAYAERNALLIEDWAAPKEVARVHQRIEELTNAGSVLEPVFQQVTVEDTQIWNNSNAFVTTVETWDVERFRAGTQQSMGRQMGQTNRVKYQLKRGDGGGWRVLYRTIQE